MPPTTGTRRLLPFLLAAAMLAAMTAPADARPSKGDRAEPLVVGHRGASG
jgi:hypothetical protein